MTEYWRFDHAGGKCHRVPLGGDRLVEGAYLPIPLSATDDGIIWGHSQVLGLDVCWDKGRPRFYNPATKEYLPDYAEVLFQRDSTMAALAGSAALAAAETRRADEAEAELRRLREQLRRETSE